MFCNKVNDDDDDDKNFNESTKKMSAIFSKYFF